MEKEQRNRLQKATQDARKLLEEEFRSQLLQTYDIDVEKVRWAEEPGAHLQAEQRLIREKLVAWIEHKQAQIHDRKEALLLALREMAFTALNRFVALKLMEARELVRPCVSGGLESAGFLEFSAVAQGLLADQESSYRLYLETIFEDVSRELRALFDPRDPASLLWPKRTALLELLDILNRPELAELWIEDETLGWVYQYFNGDAERKKMREESSAPRNSRELAVRNQFFTPRYVVEFLTDNTLGRIWYEMRQGNTKLKDRCRYLVRRPNEVWLQPGEEPPAQADADEALSQEELLRQPVYIPHRPLKDPREILMLDPACGSMHFGLYAFDLYLEIYAEAWEIAQGSDEQFKQEEAFSPFVAYAAGVADKAAFLRDVPRLILHHNIHGIDIDPRATQIARLTLWLRAQRAWQEQQLQVANRSVITRSNVVCAEPMPGERELLADFIDQQFPEAERGLAQQLLETIFDKMQLAGEAGSLLKIEEEIRDAIDQARREWQKLAIHQRDLFSATELSALGGVSSSLNADLLNLTKDFWINIEDRIYAALHDYANQAESGDFQRRLFAEDAAQGFAFIDICRKRHDAVVMNPPFGAPSIEFSESFSRLYPDSCANFLCAFTNLALEFCGQGGLAGAITDRTWLQKTTYERFRSTLLTGEHQLLALADLGWGILDDAQVAACLFTATSASPHSKHVACIDLRGDTVDQKQQELGLGLVSNKSKLVLRNAFSLYPDHAIAHWCPESLNRLFLEGTSIQPSLAESKRGFSAGDTALAFRLEWEVPPDEKRSCQRWSYIQNGGSYSPFYRDTFLVCWSENSLAVLRPLKGVSLKNLRYVGRIGLTWPKRSDYLSPCLLPKGHYFTDEGSGLFSEDVSTLWFLLGILNSSTFQYALELFCGQHKSNGYLAKLPIPPLTDSHRNRIAEAAKECYLLASSFRRTSEPNTGFVAALLDDWARVLRSHGLNYLMDTLHRLDDEVSSRMSALQMELDSLAFGLARVDDMDVSLINDATRSRPKISSYLFQDLPQARADYNASRLHLILSYLLGVAFGRWDVRYVNGQLNTPPIPDPFDPLPLCPPGMLQDGEGLPLSADDYRQMRTGGLYPFDAAWGGVIVSDKEHPLCIINCIKSTIRAICPDNGDSIYQEASEMLGVQDLGIWFGDPASFFSRHLSCYTRGRRQAPIYWQLSASSGSYSVWLYYHRFTQDTLYRVLRDFIEPRIQQTEREQFEIQSQGALSGDAAKRLQETQTLLQDLRIFKSELDLVAPLWNPNLNDGVIINHSILWRITPYTPWQKKCKECWDKLVKGDYDWAHLAFHLWPERVIPNCTTDRSLAIAHGLQERLWQETNNGNWLPRQLSEADLQALITEHSNPAVKSALERFLAAPPPVAPTRTRAPRATRSTASGTTRKPRGGTAVVDAEATRQTLLVLTAAPAEGLSKNAIAAALEVEPGSLTAVIKQLKAADQIEQLGAARGARYRLTEKGRAAVASQAGEDD